MRHPAKDVHIVPGIECDSLLSIPKFVNANYIAIFNKVKVNIYDTNKTLIIVSCGAILQGWQCKQTNLWRVPLIKEIKNNNTDTVLCDPRLHFTAVILNITPYYCFLPPNHHK
jgi:hypothetical protein